MLEVHRSKLILQDMYDVVPQEEEAAPAATESSNDLEVGEIIAPFTATSANQLSVSY